MQSHCSNLKDLQCLGFVPMAAFIVTFLLLTFYVSRSFGLLAVASGLTQKTYALFASPCVGCCAAAHHGLPPGSAIWLRATAAGQETETASPSQVCQSARIVLHEEARAR
eukprot:3119013-Amphidinium_carterae.3